jgi:CrcB protein
VSGIAAVAWVCLGGAFGAPARYLADRYVQSRHDGVMPWGTLGVNVVGSFVLGALTGLAAGHDLPRQVVLAVGTGVCGAFTTYSTFSYETLRLFEEDARLLSVANAVLSVAGAVGAALAGYGLASMF